MVVVMNEVVDSRHEIADAAERAAADGPPGDDVEPDLHLVEPGGVGRGVVHMEAGTGGKPASDLRMLVRGVVVDDQMDLEFVGHGGLDVAQELQELLVAMPALALGEDLALSDVQRREQRGRPVSDVVVRDPLDIAQPEREDRLRAIEGLDLTLLVDAQHDRVIRRVEIEPDDIAHLLDKERVGGQLEMLLAVGLEPKGRPDAMDG